MSTTDKEGLELIALAMGIELCFSSPENILLWAKRPDGRMCGWNPRTNIADCAEMEAALKINVKWHTYDAFAEHARLWSEKSFSDHGGAQAARMAASCAVGEQIGRRIREGKA